MVRTDKEQDLRNRTFANSSRSNVPARPASLHIIEGSDQSHADGSSTKKKDAQICIGVIDEHSLTRVCITRSLQDLGGSLEIVSFADCEECLQSRRTFDIILYHAHESLTKGHNDQRLTSFDQLPKIAPVIILSQVESTAFLLESFERGARGFIPTASTTPEVLIKIIDVIRAGGMFVFPGSPAPFLKS